MSQKKYDYIIVGAGCSGLSLLARLIDSQHFAKKKILLIDRAPKTLNDRTWCFWEQSGTQQPVPFFNHLVYHEWHQLHLRHYKGHVPLQIAPYSYKMIRGIDFYRHCFKKINAAPNVQICYGEVTQIDTQAGTVTTPDETYAAEIIFSSALLDTPFLAPKNLYLLQHFRGWWVETDYDAFNPAEADLMNFRTSQQHGCAFVYVLPVSRRQALVEYTLFTEEPLTSQQYDEGLQTFVKEELKLQHYKINEIENGVIPMTNMQFPLQQGNVFFIGTAGGQTKASTGYTFQFIQKQAAAIVSQLIKTGSPVLPKPPQRFGFYDSVLLQVLHERKLNGADVFYRMFTKNKATTVFQFLDNETNLWQEIQLMNSTNKRVFLPAAIKQL